MNTSLSEKSPLIEQRTTSDRWVVSCTGTTQYGREDRALRFASYPETFSSLRVADHGYELVFDGRLYNREELAKNLNIAKVSECSDARLVLTAFVRWGENALQKIRGVFALVLWNETSNRLLGSRDHFGVYPLFFTDTGKEILFSVFPQELAAHPGVNRALNRAALADYLCFRSDKLEETFYKNIHRVPPGHLVRINRSGYQVEQYWHPFLPQEESDWVDDQEIQRFDDLFNQAVERCFQNGPPGIFLSGGLDSVSVCSVAVDLARQKHYVEPLALSIAFPDPACNEEDIQRSVASQLGIDQIMLPYQAALRGGTLLGQAVELGREWSMPMINPWRPIYSVLAMKAYERGCRVILTGGGGDEWLTVNHFYITDLLRKGDLPGCYRFLRNSLRSYDLPRIAMLRFLIWRTGIRSLLALNVARIMARYAPKTLFKRRLRIRNEKTWDWIAPDPLLRQELYERLEETVASSMKKPIPKGGYGFYFQQIPEDFFAPFKSTLMEEEFEAGNRMGIRFLKPYFDPDLVEFLLRVHPDRLMAGGREKGLVRQTISRRFPELRFERQKKVSAVNFFQSILLTDGPVVWDKMGGLRGLAELGIIDGRMTNRIKEDMISSKDVRVNNRIWTLLCLESWVRPRI